MTNATTAALDAADVLIKSEARITLDGHKLYIITDTEYQRAVQAYQTACNFRDGRYRQTDPPRGGDAA